MATTLEAIARIRKSLDLLERKAQSDPELTEFDNIDSPFRLTETTVHLWQMIYPTQVLQQLASQDSDVIEAWAIALNQTIQTELEILKTWYATLDTLPLPAKLAQKTSDRITEIANLASQKSALLQAAKSIFSKEEELRSASAELKHLQTKQTELTKMSAEIAATNIPELRQQVTRLAETIEPQAQTLHELQQQKLQIQTQITNLQQQQQAIASELEHQRSRHDRTSSKLFNDIDELILLTKEQRSRLDQNLQTAIQNLEQEHKEYQQQWEQLQQAIQASNRYQIEIEAIRADFNNHYQSDQELSAHIHHDRTKITNISNVIRDRLLELDQELANNRQILERSSQKNIITF